MLRVMVRQGMLRVMVGQERSAMLIMGSAMLTGRVCVAEEEAGVALDGRPAVRRSCACVAPDALLCLPPPPPPMCSLVGWEFSARRTPLSHGESQPPLPQSHYGATHTYTREARRRKARRAVVVARSSSNMPHSRLDGVHS